MKKNVLFSPLFLYNLALITHDATKSVNPSIYWKLLAKPESSVAIVKTHQMFSPRLRRKN